MSTIKQVPYEFLARWGDDGKLKGAHVGFRTIVTDDNGKVILDQAQAVQPVAFGSGDKGFPLTDVLDELHITSIERSEAAVEAQAAAEEEAKNLKDEVGRLEGELNAATAMLAAKSEELTRVQAQAQADREAAAQEKASLVQTVERRLSALEQKQP